ncbi:hypothetical protein B0H12DRAFT_1121563 [Mycena haematopus]|nr:hypothetical protein B0H12DRAFT_1121563 [Mycena haematopus]
MHRRAPPQQPVIIPLAPHILDAVLPNTTDAERMQSFRDIVDAKGSVAAAKAYLERHYEFLKTGVVIGAARPPPNAIIHRTNVGPLRLFYHSTFPADLQENSPFSWNLYIGLANRDEESIMPDWEDHGILVEIPNLIGHWERCGALTLLPSTRVRITYPDSSRRGRNFKEEIILPGDPKDVHIPVRLLPPPPPPLRRIHVKQICN